MTPIRVFFIRQIGVSELRKSGNTVRVVSA